MNKFEQACIASYKEWENSLPNIESLPDPQYSKKHNKRMNRLFDQMRGNSYHHLTGRAVRILIAAAMLCALLLCAFATPSSRKTIVEKFDGFGKFKITQSNGNMVTDLRIGYIPKGYEFESYSKDFKIIDFRYVSSDGDLLVLSKNSSGVKLLFNTENCRIEEIVIDNITYTYVTDSNEYKTLMWNKQDYIYSVSGGISKEELIKIAQNMK